MTSSHIPLSGSTTVTIGGMSRRVSSFPKSVRTPPTNWSRWADGGKHELRRGVDFSQGTKQARNAFITWCGRHEMSCHTTISEGKLYVQAWDR